MSVDTLEEARALQLLTCVRTYDHEERFRLSWGPSGCPFRIQEIETLPATSDWLERQYLGVIKGKRSPEIFQRKE